MADEEKIKDELKDAALYGKEAGRARVSGPVITDQLFRVGPFNAAEEIARVCESLRPTGFIDAAQALTAGQAIAAAVTANIFAQFPQHTMGNILADFMREAQRAATNFNAQPVAALALAEAMKARAERVGEAVYNWILLGREGELCQSEREQEQAQELGEVG